LAAMGKALILACRSILAVVGGPLRMSKTIPPGRQSSLCLSIRFRLERRVTNRTTGNVGAIWRFSKKAIISTGSHISSAPRMLFHLGLGEKDKALDWLEKCYEEQDGYCWGPKIFPIFAPLRTEARFQALLTKVGLDQ
jgi:hypothetical protein